MLEFLAHLLSSQGFESHGHCYLWLPEILWLHVISDAFIVLAYYSIPIARIYLIRNLHVNAYIRKPIGFHRFAETLRIINLFWEFVELPE